MTFVPYPKILALVLVARPKEENGTSEIIFIKNAEHLRPITLRRSSLKLAMGQFCCLLKSKSVRIMAMLLILAITVFVGNSLGVKAEFPARTRDQKPLIDAKASKS
jgi:hypothetical protein